MNKKTTFPQTNKNFSKLDNFDSFLETLRELGEGPNEELLKEKIKRLSKKISGELKQNQTLNFAEIKNSNEKRERIKKFSPPEFLDIHQRENLIWLKKEENIKLQITEILQELKKLSASVGELAEEVKVAEQQVPAKPGVYHLSFFEKIRQILVLLRKKVEESTTWLAIFNQKIQKRNYYWAQVRKSGTKFMLSQERYTATQVG